MLTIEFTSLSGHYHATPWDRQVNEGVVEWPPAPWRLLRALIGVRHARASDEIAMDALEDLVTLLATELPEYDLPPVTEAHTRHYLPDSLDKTKLHLQTFAHLGKQTAFQVRWPTIDLNPEQTSALAVLLERFGYLGRAESWFEAKIADNEPTRTFNTRLVADQALDPTKDYARLLAATPAKDYSAWRAQQLESMMERELSERVRKAQDKGKAPPKSLTPAQKKKVSAALPETLLGTLEAETLTLNKQGWSVPPGTRWAHYEMPQETSATYRPHALASPRWTVARFAVISNAAPLLADGFVVADRLHKALVKHSDGAPVFTGCNAAKEPLQGHTHAFILPESYGNQGRITHFTVYATMGFDEHARRALESVRWLWNKRGDGLQLVLLGLGHPEDFAGWNAEAGQCPLFVSAERWRSRTPFLSTRHVKRRRNGIPKRDDLGRVIGGAEHDLVRLLTEAGTPPNAVQPTEGTVLGTHTRWLKFRTQRNKGSGRRGESTPCGFELHFDAPIAGPIGVGFGAHLGLGQFEPIRTS